MSLYIFNKCDLFLLMWSVSQFARKWDSVMAERPFLL